MVIEKHIEHEEDLMSLQELIADSRKIVIKIGSNTLSTDKGAVNTKAMHNIVEQLVEWMKDGKDIIIVSSGAGICGVGAINKWFRRKDMNYKQLLVSHHQFHLTDGA